MIKPPERTETTFIKEPLLTTVGESETKLFIRKTQIERMSLLAENSFLLLEQQL